MNKQKTLRNSFSLQGKGLHTGLDISISFKPAPENHGYKIKRTDLDGNNTLDVVAENVIETNRGTVIAKNNVQVSTIEHAIAALYAYEIDNCLIEVNAPEFPILDGSAILYTEKIEEVGIKEQEFEKDYFIIRKKIEFTDEATGSSYVLLPDDSFCINTLISFNSPILSNQYATLEKLSDFKEQIAPARTFVFIREIEMLLKNNLIKGGDLDNAIVIYDKKIPQEELDALADIMKQPKKSVEHLGYLNNRPLVFENEPARHKLMDLIGDLALIGKPIKGRVIATRPGHGSNNKLARKIRKEIKRLDVQTPIYDPNEKPLLDINQIKELLPHRFPFLMVDKIIEKGDKYIVGVKNVTGNENFFNGHFPGNPVMPGVLQIEGMAQTGGLLALDMVEDSSNCIFYFLKIDNARFRQTIVPGDTIIFKVEILSPVKHNCVTMKGYAFVGESIVSEAEFLAQIIKLK